MFTHHGGGGSISTLSTHADILGFFRAASLMVAAAPDSRGEAGGAAGWMSGAASGRP